MRITGAREGQRTPYAEAALWARAPRSTGTKPSIVSGNNTVPRNAGHGADDSKRT